MSETLDPVRKKPKQNTADKVAYGVLVEEVQDHVRQPRVAPMSVHQQELLQIPETRESKVARHHRLQNTRDGPD